MVEASASLMRPLAIARRINSQDLTEHQMCLLESLFQKHSMDDDIFYDLLPHITSNDIISHPDMSDLQVTIVQEVIETASLSNDVNETLFIQSILHRRRRVRGLNFQGFRSYRDYQRPRYVPYGPFRRLRGDDDNPRFTFSFSPEKAELVSFILRHGDTNNHYHEHRILNVILEADEVTPQDIRNVKIALMTAGQDFSDSQQRNPWPTLDRYAGFSRTDLIRYMLGHNFRHDISRQHKDLFALVAALEHPDNGIYEPRIFRGIAINIWREFAPEEYQCIVDALHAYMAPGQEGKSRSVSNNLNRMIQTRTCLKNPYFDRPYFREHDIQHTLDEALKTLEDGGEVVVPYQCVGDPCP